MRESEELGTWAGLLDCSSVPSWYFVYGNGGGVMVSVRTVQEKHQQSVSSGR